MKSHLLLLTSIILLVSSCAGTSSQKTRPTSKATKPSSSRKPEVSSPKRGALSPEQLRMLGKAGVSNYLLGGGDVVRIFGNDISGLDRTFILGPDGRITVPEIGVLKIGGLTRQEAATEIEDKLQKVYRSPKISLLVEAYNNNRINILGEVGKPGQYDFTASASLLNALAKAGGPTATADLRSCSIVRGRNAVIEIDLEDLLRKGNRSLDIPLLPNDSIYVRAKQPDAMNEQNTFFVLGEVRNPGIFPTSAEGEQLMDAVRAISMAGGNTNDAALDEVRIVRRNPQGPPTVYQMDIAQILDGGAVYLRPISPGDILYVPRKGVATFRYYIDQVVPSLNAIILGVALDNSL